MILPIITSRSAVASHQSCPRKRYLNYEMPNGTSTPGWERKAIAIPLGTGIHSHYGLECRLKGFSAYEAARAGSQRYLQEIDERGLEVEEGSDVASVIAEQTAAVEALVLGWSRARFPRWQDEFEIVAVEQEDRTALSDDVTLAVRQDAIVRRKADQRMFVVNFKTVGQADERWLRQWEVDMQLMTELVAAERRYGQEFGGVIIEGLVKGPRVGVDQWLKEVRGDDAKDKIHHYADRSRLLYGYKCDPDPPLQAGGYQWEGTTRKGWRKFETWKENFGNQQGQSSLQYWINWLPIEVVESQFVVVPPIYRDNERIESCIMQIVAIETNIRADMMALEAGASLDATFPQNTHSCTYPGKCPFYEACWERGTLEDMEGSGLYRPRVDHHAVKGSE